MILIDFIKKVDKREQKQWPVIVGLLLAVVGVIAPIGWDLLRNNSTLELIENTQTSIIQKNDNLDKLSVLYDGHPVKALTILHFSIANAGSKPIKDSDLIALPTILFTNSITILDAKIDGAYPPNLSASIFRSNNPVRVSLSFPLLNPGDNFQFSILIGDSGPVSYKAEARIVGVSAMKIMNQSEGPRRAERRGSWFVYIISIFSVILLFASMLGFIETRKERQFKRRVKNGTFHLPLGLSVAIARRRANFELSWTTHTERIRMNKFLSQMPSDKILDQNETELLEKMMQECSEAAMSNVAVAIFTFVTAMAGIIYVSLQLFH